LPADLLIANDGRLIACHYGEHVYDQWSVDALLGYVSPESCRKPATSVGSLGPSTSNTSVASTRGST
jgi:hypothetical protein